MTRENRENLIGPRNILAARHPFAIILKKAARERFLGLARMSPSCHLRRMDSWAVFFRRVHRRLRRQGRTRQDAEDLIQEAFLRMQLYCNEGGEVHEPEAFLARTVRRLSLNARRDQHDELYTEEPFEKLPLIDLGPTPDEVLAADECLRKMTETLDAINRRTREVFFLHRLDGFSYAQIAQQLGISISAIEKHIARATAALTDEVLRT